MCKDPDEHTFRMTFTEKGFDVVCDTKDKDFNWSLDLHAASNAELPFKDISDKAIKMQFNGFDYEVNCTAGSVERTDEGTFRLRPDGNSIGLNCTNNR